VDINQIDLGENFARTRLQGSGTLVISFEFGGDEVDLTDADRAGFAQQMIHQAGWDGLFILPKRHCWYQSPELRTFFRTLRDIGFFDDYTRVVTYGFSMGGFAALAFAGLAGATQVVAFNPRTTLDASVLRWPSPLSLKLKYNRKGPRADVLSELPETTSVTIFVDPFSRRDKPHANRVLAAHKQTELVRVPFIGHGVPRFLKQEGLLKKTAFDAISGRFDRKWFYQAIRNRRLDAEYHVRMKAALALRSGRGQPESPVIQQGVRDFGTDPKEHQRDPSCE